MPNNVYIVGHFGSINLTDEILLDALTSFDNHFIRLVQPYLFGEIKRRFVVYDLCSWLGRLRKYFAWRDS